MSTEAFIVCDNGSGVYKVGFSGECSPRLMFPTTVGRSRQPRQFLSVGQKTGYITEKELCKVSPIINYVNPIEKGIVTDWEALMDIWDHVFDVGLRLVPGCHPILLSETPNNPKQKREKMVELWFENYKIPALYLAKQPVMALFASGRTTGMVVDCGDQLSYASPVYEGFALPYAVLSMPIGGRELTDYLMRLLVVKGYPLTSRIERNIVQNMKHKYSYVALDFDQELVADPSLLYRQYELPDGQLVTIDKERFSCTEPLFQPSQLNVDSPGLPELTVKAMMKCEVDLKKELASNILLAGGATLSPGFGARMQKEVTALSPASWKIKIISPPERKYSAWVGGSIMASASTFQHMWIAKEEYEEIGPTIVHQKCF